MDVVGLLFGSWLLFVHVGIIIGIVYVARMKPEMREDEDFGEKYGVFYDFARDSAIARSYWVMFLVRRLLISILIVFLWDVPFV